jgi:hypothetical protein
MLEQVSIAYDVDGPLKGHVIQLESNHEKFGPLCRVHVTQNEADPNSAVEERTIVHRVTVANVVYITLNSKLSFDLGLEDASTIRAK